MSAPDWNTTITIRNRHLVALTRESVTATGGAPNINVSATIAPQSNGVIASAAVSPGIGTQGNVQFFTTDGGGNRVQIWIDFACNNNNVTVTTRTSRNTIHVVRTDPPGTGPVGNPLTVTFDVTASG